MFYYIKGEIAHKGQNFVAVDVNGVCYKIYTSLSCIGRCGEVGGKAKFFTHLHLREDIMDLYGFTTQEELTMFEHLISVTGVGPKAGLSILSVTSPEKFALAVVTGDTKTLTKASGVGPKMAQRVILELKDRLKNEDISAVMDIDDDMDYSGDSMSEAVNALVVLGYAPQEAKKAIVGADSCGSVEEIIKFALKKLMK